MAVVVVEDKGADTQLRRGIGGRHERSDRSVAAALDVELLPLEAQRRGDAIAGVARLVSVRHQLVRFRDRKIVVVEQLVEALSGELPALCVGDCLHRVRELHLQAAR